MLIQVRARATGRTCVFLGLLTLGLACGRADTDLLDNPNRGPMSPGGTQAVRKELGPPSLQRVPTETPLPTVAISGHADAAHVFVHGGGPSIAADVLPDGTFCIDAPLAANALNLLEIVAQDRAGSFSPPVKIQVNQQPSAPPPSSELATCRSAGGSTCGTREVCNNGVDDDCNGRTDGADPACAGTCQNDYFGDNHSPDLAPRLLMGTAASLSLCPDQDNWYEIVPGRAGEFIRISLQVTNVGAGVDVDMALYDSATARTFDRNSPSAARPVATDSSTANPATLTYQVPSFGATSSYKLRVYLYRPTSQAVYNLTRQ